MSRYSNLYINGNEIAYQKDNVSSLLVALFDSVDLTILQVESEDNKPNYEYYYTSSSTLISNRLRVLGFSKSLLISTFNNGLEQLIKDHTDDGDENFIAFFSNFKFETFLVYILDKIFKPNDIEYSKYEYIGEYQLLRLFDGDIRGVLATALFFLDDIEEIKYEVSNYLIEDIDKELDIKNNPDFLYDFLAKEDFVPFLFRLNSKTIILT